MASPLHPPLEFADYITDHTQAFSGRDWVFANIDDWLCNQTSRILLLTGGPGSGKTAIAGRLAQMASSEVSSAYPALSKDSLAFVYFCQAFNDRTLDPQRFVEALSWQLANRYQRFAQELMRAGEEHIAIDARQEIVTVANGATVNNVVINSLHIGEISARKAFDRIVRRPLEWLCTPDFNKRIVLLVDALDEALSYTQTENLVSLLREVTDHPQDIPPQVRLILTSRPDHRVIDLFEAKPLDLTENSRRNDDDVRSYVATRLQMSALPNRETLAEKVAEASKGNFLYARHILNDLIARPEQAAEPDHLELPKDLNAIYRRFLERELSRDNADWTTLYRPLLGVLAVARGDGLTRAVLRGIAGAQASADDALKRCEQYLLATGTEGPFRIYHQSFREFLLENKQYHVYPAEAHTALADYLLGEYAGAWDACDDAYALGYTASHLLESLPALAKQARHTRITQLVDLLTDRNFQQAHLERLNDLPRLQRDLEAMLHCIASDKNPLKPAVLIRVALALVRFRHDYLHPQALFELTRSSELERALQRLPLFGAFGSHWQQATRLVLGWLALSEAPERTRELVNQARAADVNMIEHLVQRIEAELNRQLPALPPLAPIPADEVVDAILERMGGGMNPQGFQVLVRAGVNWPTGIETMGDEAPRYLAEIDAPLLVAYAAAHPEAGTTKLRQYISIHAANKYVFYRNEALWVLLQEILKHPDPHWVRDFAEQLCGAALAGSEVNFTEALRHVVLALHDRARMRNAVGEIDAVMRQAMDDAGRITIAREGDPWSHALRRLAVLAEIYAGILARPDVADQLLDLALQLPYGYAGFRAPACLTLAETLRVCRPHDAAKQQQALRYALIATHNIQEPRFCLLTTARVNALTRRWWDMAAQGWDVCSAASQLTETPTASLFAPLHIVGETFAERTCGPQMIEIPSDIRDARTLEDIAAIYHQPLKQLAACNGMHDEALTTVLAEGTEVMIPDDGFAPYLAALLTAEARVTDKLNKAQKTRVVQSLVPLAVTQPTILDIVLARLLIADPPDDGDLSRLASLVSLPVGPVG